MAAALLASLLLGGCPSPPPDRLGSCVIPAESAGIVSDPRRGIASTTLSVLTYNVEGLPWPARSRRGPALRRIRDVLAELRRAGTGPDIVLLQEAFTRSAADIATFSGYAAYVGGPGASQARPRRGAAHPSLEERIFWRAETVRPLLPGGLYVASRFPIVTAANRPFSRHACAGWDCLANKGVQHVRIAIPGVPTPVDLFNTHLNSRGHSGVSHARSRLAHHAQIDEFARFVRERRDARHPLLFGGDFNMRNAPLRFSRFDRWGASRLVHQYCLDRREACGVRLSWDGDEPWMDTQDLQGFESGPAVTVEPVLVAATYDQPWRGRPLSDHDAFLVVYRLSWPIAAASTAPGRACARLTPNSGARSRWR